MPSSCRRPDRRRGQHQPRRRRRRALSASQARFPGSFGSAYLYFLVPRVILFPAGAHPAHPGARVDFVSAPGTSPPDVYRPGRPLCAGDRPRYLPLRPSTSTVLALLARIRPSRLTRFREATGFAYDEAPNVPTSEIPDAGTLTLLRTEVAKAVAHTYPTFARQRVGHRGKLAPRRHTFRPLAAGKIEKAPLRRCAKLRPPRRALHRYPSQAAPRRPSMRPMAVRTPARAPLRKLVVSVTVELKRKFPGTVQ